MLLFTITGGLFGAITVYFLVAYRRTSPDQQGALPAMNLSQTLTWTLVPVFLFLADDFYLAANGWKLWNHQRQVPASAVEVQTTAEKWAWTFEYENGAQSDTEIIVEQNKPVVFRMTSDDVIHGLFVPDYRIKEDIMPGRKTFIWFYPTEIGEHVFTCTEYCGTNHSNMAGTVRVLSADDYAAWMAENA